MWNLRAFNLDHSKHLTTFRDLPDAICPRTFNKEIEKRLELPIENQVIFVNGKKLTANTTFRIDPYNGVLLGYRPTTKSDVDYKLYSKFNGSFVNISILSKFTGHEILKRFNSNPLSTYLDLKIYIESKLNIPADLQVILRRDLEEKYYWEPKNDEYVMNYVFGDCDLKYKEENIVHLMVKESTRYVSDKDDIIKIKPISIYSQHGPDEMTKIMTILPNEHIFTISEMKSKIEKKLGLPTASQIIYNATDKNEIKRFGMIDADDGVSSVFHCFDSEYFENEVILYLICDSNGDEKSSQICKKHGIKILEVQIETPSGNVIAKCKPTPTSKTFGSLKSIVKNTHKLSIKKQLFYCTDFSILNDDKSIWEHFGWRMVNGTCTIYLFMKSPESKDENEICERLDIPQISPGIVVKSLDGRKELFKTNMDRLENFFHPPLWFNYLIQDIKEKLQTPSQFVLSFCGEIFDENHPLTQRDWKHLCYREGIVQEEITFNLTFKPSLNARVYDIPTLKTLKVMFLTNEMDIDLCKEPMESILRIKGYISDKKKIPARAIDIFFNGRKLNDHENLLVLFIKEYSSPNSLEFHVVIKTINVKINLKKSLHRKRLTLPVDHITLPGSRTFYNVKEEIASLTGIPISQLRITCIPGIPDKFFIYDFVCDQVSKEIEVTVWKTVTVRVVDKHGNITRHTQHDITYDCETVDSFLSRLNIDKRFKLQKKEGISRNTLLDDLSTGDNIEFKEDSYCKLM